MKHFDCHKRVVMALVGLLLAAASVQAQHQVRLPSGDIVSGSEIRLDEAGNYVLTTPRGDLTFPAGTPVIVAEPAAYGQAQQQMRQGRHQEAIRLLQATIETYRGLQWDARARVLLADALHARGDFALAAETYDRVSEESPQVFEDLDRLGRYFDALRRSDRGDDLQRAMRRTIRNGTRPAAARAQMLRGNLNLERGEFEMAALDFLRTVELFQDVPEVQPEALSKTVETLRQLGHPDAETFARRQSGRN